MSPQPITLNEVQANVLLPYTRANCARLVCFRFSKDREQLAAVRAWMAAVSRLVTFHSDVRDAQGLASEGDGPWCNVGVTFTGMQALGYDPFTLRYMPEAFIEGMHARLGRLGDTPGDKSPYKGSDVHVAVLCYAYDDKVEQLARKLGDDAHEWRALVHDQMRELETAVQKALAATLARIPTSTAVTHVTSCDHDAYRLSSARIVGVEYFGFRDGIANPRFEGVPSEDPLTDTPPGAVLLGYPPPRQSTREPEVPGGETRAELALRQLRNGSFLVVRNLGQDVDGFRSELAAKAKGIKDLRAEDLAEHMMGRRRDGTPFAPLRGNGSDIDAFDYDDDPHGARCPFQAHARRVNPRDERAHVRRIVRRGMPTSGYQSDRPKHGLLFLCYNADIETQFEFIQHQWINAGAESHGLSVDRDPVAGDPAPSGAEHRGSSFTFTSSHDRKPHTITGLHSYVKALWGEYFLAPSRSTLAELSADPRSALAEYLARTANETDLAVRRDILGRWLDDPEMCRRIFAEVRDTHRGVYRLDRDAVVLVASAEHITTVVRDDGAQYSVARQGMAMRQTTGAFYLGMDPNTKEYREDSAASAIIAGWRPQQSEADMNKELDGLKLAAFELCVAYFGLSVTDALARNQGDGPPLRGEIELEKLTAFVIAGMCPKLFGVPQPSAVGTFQMNIAHSGYLFFAFPEETFLEQADRAARGISMYLAQLFVERDRRQANQLFPANAGRVGSAPLPATNLPQGQVPDVSWQPKLNSTLEQLEAIFSAQGRTCELDDKVRLLAGIVSGLLITSFKVFVDGVSDYAKTFKPGAQVTIAADRAANLPFAMMQQNERSMPNIVYRRAVGAARLGSVQVAPGDFVLASQGSAMASSGEEWFFGDATSAAGVQGRAPHFCPGYRVATAVLQTMSQLLFTKVPDLQVTDDTGEIFSYDWAGLRSFVEQIRQAAADAAKAAPGSAV